MERLPFAGIVIVEAVTSTLVFKNKDNSANLLYMELQVSCIVKSDRYNPHERIHSIGGVYGGKRWQFKEDDAIGHIESGKYSFHTLVRGERARVIIARHSGRKYLKTEADGLRPDNLLSLAQCPLY